jgi:tRNA A-37 threonylcarbamoyl transferase component Bud32
MATRTAGVLGPYRLLEEIGSGGMSTIYRGEQAALDRPVAIKELRAPLAADEEMVLRFEREAKASAALSHQNIVQIFDFIRKGGNAYIVMEYVDGVDLARVLREVGRLPVRLALAIVYQVCLALEHAHRRGLVHRDVKPSNVMISTEGRVKLMDFGIAHNRKETLTQPGAFLGTPAYMSPEQVMGASLGPASDVFSFGILLFELVSGVRPFVDDAAGSIGQKITEGRYPDPRRVAPALPRGAVRLLRTCLQTKPDRRYRDATEVRFALEALLSKHDLTGAREAVVRYLAERGIFNPKTAVERLPRAPLAPRLWRGAATALKLLITSVVAAQWLTWAAAPEMRLAEAYPRRADAPTAWDAYPRPRPAGPAAPASPGRAAAPGDRSAPESPRRPEAAATQESAPRAALVAPAGFTLVIDDRTVDRVIEVGTGRHLVELRPLGAPDAGGPPLAPGPVAPRGPDVTPDAR